MTFKLLSVGGWGKNFRAGYINVDDESDEIIASTRVAKKASSILRSKSYSRKSRSVAGSALSQAALKTKKKK